VSSTTTPPISATNLPITRPMDFALCNAALGVTVTDPNNVYVVRGRVAARALCVHQHAST
jgi:hypothetical protein